MSGAAPGRPAVVLLAENDPLCVKIIHEVYLFLRCGPHQECCFVPRLLGLSCWVLGVISLDLTACGVGVNRRVVGFRCGVDVSIFGDVFFVLRQAHVWCLRAARF